MQALTSCKFTAVYKQVRGGEREEQKKTLLENVKFMLTHICQVQK